MNYTIEVFYTNSTNTRRYHTNNLTDVWRVVERQKTERFVRKIDVLCILETFTVFHPRQPGQ